MFKKVLMTTLVASAFCNTLPIYAQQRTAAVLRFAVQSESSADSSEFSSQACRQDDRNANSTAVQPQILDAISSEIQKGLAQKMPVIADPDRDTIPVGSVIISGCIFKAEKGSAAGRVIGMNMGASRLAAHVVFLAKDETGFTPVDSFDVQVKGGSAMPALDRLDLPPTPCFGPARISPQTLASWQSRL